MNSAKLQRLAKFFTILFLMLTASECTERRGMTHFMLHYTLPARIERTTPVDTPVHVFTPPVHTETAKACENHNTHRDLIQSVVLKKLTLEILRPDEADFSVFRDLKIYILADGVDHETLIGRLSGSISAESKEADLEIIPCDVREYLQSEVFMLRLRIVLNGVLPADYDVAVHTAFDVTAKTAGI